MASSAISAQPVKTESLSDGVTVLPIKLPSDNKDTDLVNAQGWRPRFSKKDVSALCSVLALTASLMVYGILQERIMTVPFGPDKRRFRHSLFLVLCNRLVACFLALLTVYFTRGKVEPVAPLHSYGLISIANVVSSVCQYEALKYVSFPVQVLAKCTKMIPVMVWQSIIARARYSVREYLEATVVALGCAIFLLTGEVSSTGTAHAFHRGAVYFMGGGILVIYLAVDGFTSTWQDWLFTGYQMDIGNQVLYTTLCSICLSSCGLLVSGKFHAALEFVRNYPEVWWWIVGISLASAAVQFLVTHTIKEYGALIFATVMTTRQWFSILLSCLLFAHPLTSGQWYASMLIGEERLCVWYRVLGWVR